MDQVYLYSAVNISLLQQAVHLAVITSNKNARDVQQPGLAKKEYIPTLPQYQFLLQVPKIFCMNKINVI